MTKRDFELIASVVREIDDDATRRQVANAFCARLALLNDRFDNARFLSACKAEG
jgi:hypothetical protein